MGVMGAIAAIGADAYRRAKTDGAPRVVPEPARKGLAWMGGPIDDVLEHVSEHCGQGRALAGR